MEIPPLCDHFCNVCPIFFKLVRQLQIVFISSKMKDTLRYFTNFKLRLKLNGQFVNNFTTHPGYTVETFTKSLSRKVLGVSFKPAFVGIVNSEYISLVITHMGD